jgi:hypothetical protein
MSDTGEHGHDEVRRVQPRRAGAASVILALTAAFGYGAIDQYLGALKSSFLADVSMMSAPWLLVPFLAGAGQAGQRRAALVGLAATWLSVLGYVLMIISPMEGTHLGPRPAGMIGSWNQLSPHLFLTTLTSQWLWFAGGVIAGPLYGWLGYRWRSLGSRTTTLLAVLPVVFEPAARWLADHSGLASASGLAFREFSYGPAAIAEVAVGVALTVIAVRAITRVRVPGGV